MEMHQLMETLGRVELQVKYRVANQSRSGQAGAQLSGEKLKVETGFGNFFWRSVRFFFFFWVLGPLAPIAKLGLLL